LAQILVISLSEQKRRNARELRTASREMGKDRRQLEEKEAELVFIFLKQFSTANLNSGAPLDVPPPQKKIFFSNYFFHFFCSEITSSSF
jgi:hypothetical protein